jgi:PAS domain S-box-containing protein
MTAIPDSSRDGLVKCFHPIPDQFSRLCDSLADAIVLDDNHQVLRANAPAEAMFGYAHREMEGLQLESLLAHEVWKTDHRPPSTTADPGDAAAMWKRGLHGLRKDGSRFAIGITRSHLKMEGADLFCSVVHDLAARTAIDERTGDAQFSTLVDHRQIENDLRASQKFIEAVAKASPPMIYVFDLDEGRLTYRNRSILAELGYPESVAAIDGLDEFKAFMPLEDEAHLANVLREWRELPDGHVREDEYRLRNAHGAFHYFLGRETAFTRGTDGAVRQVLGTLYDITQRKRTEQSLVNSRALLQSFVEHTPAAVAMLDRNLRYIAVSRRWMQDYELGTGDLTGQHHYDVFPEIGRMPDWQAVHRRCLAGAVERREEDLFVRTNGRREWLRWEVRPWRNEHGEIGGIIMFTEVITERKHAESRLRESDALLRGLVETSPIPMLVVTADADSRILLMNQQFTKTFGYSIEDVPDISAWWVRAYPDPAYRDRVRAAWLHAIAEAERTDNTAIVPVMAQVICKDGSVRDLEVHMGRYGNRALVLFSDFTERKHTEELLRQSEERYRLIVENQTEFIVKWLPDGTRTFVNDNYCRTFGVREQDCLGTSFFPLVAPEYREEIRRRTAALTPELPEYRDEHVSLVPGGQCWQQWTNRGIFDADGRLVEILSTGRDISERKEAEEKLRQSRVHLLASQHIARVGSWEMDLRSLDALADNPIRCSDECFRIFGVTPGETEVTVRAFFDLVHPDDRDKVRNAGQRAVRERSQHSIDHRILLANGEERVLHQQAELALDPATDRPVKLIGTTQDITERVRLEEQLRQSQKMQAIGQLAGGVAHDFNNLLTVINGHVDMVLDHLAADNPLRAELTPIRDAGQRAALLTRQLLLFSRKAVLEPRVLNLGDVVQRTSQMLRRLISEEIDISILSPSLARVKADPTQLEQVIMNLSLNACDAMPRGGRLTIETRNVAVDANFCREHPEAVPGRYVQLVVSDTGSGMTPQVKAHLFEPFFTTKGPGRGTGLGLATVYGIVRESGGFVTVSSDLNVGTTFNVFLPALDGSDPATTTEAATHSPLRGNETVLVVEDDPGVRTITTLALKKYGYQVLEATDGPAALEVSRAHDGIDLVVTDVVMPEMSGRALADALLRTRPQCRVLFMSGYNEEMLADREANTADGFIQKPFTPVALAMKVREILDRHYSQVPQSGSA